MNVTTTKDTKFNLCNICSREYPKCSPTITKCGDGVGNDNVIKCSGFKQGPEMLAGCELETEEFQVKHIDPLKTEKSFIRQECELAHPENFPCMWMDDKKCPSRCKYFCPYEYKEHEDMCIIPGGGIPYRFLKHPTTILVLESDSPGYWWAFRTSEFTNIIEKPSGIGGSPQEAIESLFEREEEEKYTIRKRK